MSIQQDGLPPIYVGYLPVPARHRRLLRIAVPALAVLALGLAGAVGAMQRDPGPAEFRAEGASHSGTLVVAPYPILIPDDPEELPMLLVAVGKFGAASAEELHGARVEIDGRILERDHARMIEVSDAPNAIRVLSVAHAAATEPNAPHTSLVTLSGEIVDSKCCLGAMKPGEGKTHRACATLCIRGGIPPILVSADADGKAVYTLLTDGAGRPANDLVLPFVAEPVEVRGTLTIDHGVRTLAIDRIE